MDRDRCKELTGEVDCNGVEIREGDILDLGDFEVEVWWDDMSGWLVCGGFLSGDGLEAYTSYPRVGSIYERDLREW